MFRLSRSAALPAASQPVPAALGGSAGREQGRAIKQSLVLRTTALLFFDPARAPIRWPLSCLMERVRSGGAQSAPKISRTTIDAILMKLPQPCSARTAQL